MQSAEDRRCLRVQYAEAEIRPLATVLKCVAGIVTLFAVAAGPWVVLSADGGGTVAEHSGGKAVAVYPNSMEESRRVYEERHQRVHNERHQSAAGQQGGTRAALAK